MDSSGKIISTPLETGTSHEADLRTGAMVGGFNDPEPELVKFRRSLMASLAGTVFGRHPEAAKVIVKVDEFTPVSMGDYRKGIRPEWKQIYEAKFVHEPRKILGQQK